MALSESKAGALPSQSGRRSEKARKLLGHPAQPGPPDSASSPGTTAPDGQVCPAPWRGGRLPLRRESLPQTGIHEAVSRYTRQSD